jgi:DNA-binding GntR family transcriptional regulator
MDASDGGPSATRSVVYHPDVASVPPLKAGPKRASDIVEKRLVRMIVSLELPPGALIGEAELMERLGCGRTPLREALQRLSQEYLVVSIPRKGVRIAELDLADYVRLMEAASQIEAVAARLAARIADSEHLERLESVVEAAAQASRSRDILGVANLDYEFHYLVAECGANRYVIDASARLQRLASRFIYLAMKRGLTGWESLDEHHRIIAAIRARDEEAAAETTLQHWVHARDRIVAAL